MVHVGSNWSWFFILTHRQHKASLANCICATEPYKCKLIDWLTRIIFRLVAGFSYQNSMMHNIFLHTFSISTLPALRGPGTSLRKHVATLRTSSGFWTTICTQAHTSWPLRVPRCLTCMFFGLWRREATQTLGVALHIERPPDLLVELVTFLLWGDSVVIERDNCSCTD